MSKKILILIIFVSIFTIFLGILSTDGNSVSLAAEPSKLIKNPLGTTSIPTLIGRIIKAILGIVGSIALLMFIYGGFLWMTARGEAKQVEKGKDTLVWATIGLATIFFAYAAVNFVIKAMVSEGPSKVPESGEEGALACDCVMELEELQLSHRNLTATQHGLSTTECQTASFTDSICVSALGEGWKADECVEGNPVEESNPVGYYCKKEEWVPRPQTARVDGSDQDDISNRCMEICDDNVRGRTDKRCTGVRLLPETCSVTR